MSASRGRQAARGLVTLASLALLAVGTASASARSLRVAAQAPPSCPRLLPAPSPSERPGSDAVLVPLGADALVLCAYHGLNPPALARRLGHTRLLPAGATLTVIAHALDALQASVGVHGCPMDDGSADLALFAYPSLPVDRVTIDLTGCNLVTNGHITRTASIPPGPGLLARLAALLA